VKRITLYNLIYIFAILLTGVSAFFIFAFVYSAKNSSATDWELKYLYQNLSTNGSNIILEKSKVTGELLSYLYGFNYNPSIYKYNETTDNFLRLVGGIRTFPGAYTPTGNHDFQQLFAECPNGDTYVIGYANWEWDGSGPIYEISHKNSNYEYLGFFMIDQYEYSGFFPEALSCDNGSNAYFIAGSKLYQIPLDNSGITPPLVAQTTIQGLLHNEIYNPSSLTELSGPGQFIALMKDQIYHIQGASFGSYSAYPDLGNQHYVIFDEPEGMLYLASAGNGVVTQVYQKPLLSGAWEVYGSPLPIGIGVSMNLSSANGLVIGISSGDSANVYQYRSGDWQKVGSTIAAPAGKNTIDFINVSTGLGCDSLYLGFNALQIETDLTLTSVDTEFYRLSDPEVCLNPPVTPTPTETPTDTPTSTPTDTPTETPTDTPTITVTEVPLELPTVITEATTTNITINSATTGGNVTSDGGTAILERGVVYSSTQVTPTTSNANVTATTGTIGSMSIGLSSLSSNTTYHVRAYARNSVGTAYGEVVNFTTLTAIELAAPTVVTGSASNIASYQFSIGGNVTSDGGSSVLERGFVYSSTQATPTVLNASKKITSGTTGQYINTIIGLSVNTTYHVRAYARNAIGIGYGEVIDVRTSATVTTNIPVVTTNQNTTNITTNSATTGGYVVSQGSSAILERGVVYSSLQHTPSMNNATTATTSGTLGSMSIGLSSLSSNTTYYVRAFARNSVGTAYGAVAHFKTAKQATVTAPTVITGSASGIGLTSFTIDGNVTADGGSAITARGFVYSDVQAIPTVNNTTTKIVTGTMGEYSALLAGLAENKKYYVRAYAKNAVGTSYGLVVEVETTGKTNPPIVTNCPTINYFRLSKTVAKPGERVILQWKTTKAETTRISQYSTPLANEGQLSILATSTIKYSLFANTQGCVASKTVTLYVSRINVSINTLTAVGVTLMAEFAIAAMGMQGNMLTALLGYTKKRKHGVGGLVYDAETKKPLPRITLRLISSETKRVVDVTVTDSTGLFVFTPKKGKYTIEVTQKDYIYPSDIVKTKIDGGYEPVYRQEEIVIEKDNDLLRVVIPLDPLRTLQREVNRQKYWPYIESFLLFVSSAFLVAGFMYSIYATFITPLGYNYVIIVVYLLMFLFKSEAFLSMQPVRGKVVSLTGKPKEDIEIGLFDTEFNILLHRTFTKNDGTYTFLVENIDYYIQVLDNKYKIVQRNQGTLGIHSMKIKSKYPFRFISERIRIMAK